MHFSEVMKKKVILKKILKMHGYPQFPFWILIPLAKIFHKPRKNTFELVSTVLKKSGFFGSPRDAQNICAVAKERTVLNKLLPTVRGVKARL